MSASERHPWVPSHMGEAITWGLVQVRDRFKLVPAPVPSSELDPVKSGLYHVKAHQRQSKWEGLAEKNNSGRRH